MNILFSARLVQSCGNVTQPVQRKSPQQVFLLSTHRLKKRPLVRYIGFIKITVFLGVNLFRFRLHAFVF